NDTRERLGSVENLNPLTGPVAHTPEKMVAEKVIIRNRIKRSTDVTVRSRIEFQDLSRIENHDEQPALLEQATYIFDFAECLTSGYRVLVGFNVPFAGRSGVDQEIRPDHNHIEIKQGSGRPKPELLN